MNLADQLKQNFLDLRQRRARQAIRENVDGGQINGLLATNLSEVFSREFELIPNPPFPSGKALLFLDHNIDF